MIERRARDDEEQPQEEAVQGQDQQERGQVAQAQAEGGELRQHPLALLDPLVQFLGTIGRAGPAGTSSKACSTWKEYSAARLSLYRLMVSERTTCVPTTIINCQAMYTRLIPTVTNVIRAVRTAASPRWGRITSHR